MILRVKKVAPFQRPVFVFQKSAVGAPPEDRPCLVCLTSRSCLCCRFCHLPLGTITVRPVINFAVEARLITRNVIVLTFDCVTSVQRELLKDQVAVSPVLNQFPSVKAILVPIPTLGSVKRISDSQFLARLYLKAASGTTYD